MIPQMLDYLYNLPNSTTGIDSIATQTATSVPGLAPIILAFIFFFFLIGGIGRQLVKNGTADYAMWASVSSLITFVAALIMSTISGLITLDWLLIVFGLTLLCFLWLAFDKRGNDF